MGGSLLAMAARKLGLSVILIERGSHPRFAIGESTSPLMNLLLEEFAHRYDLPWLLPLAQWGTWKHSYPNLGVGKKRGFSYYAQTSGQKFSYCPDRRDQLLVAASPADPCADTHWLRADVDHWLVNEAVALGAEYHERTSIESAAVVAGAWQLALVPQPPPGGGGGEERALGRSPRPDARRCERAERLSPPTKRLAGRRLSWLPRDLRSLHALRRREAFQSPRPLRFRPRPTREGGTRRPTHPTGRRSITFSTAAGCGACASTTKR